jgi:polysaccharide pyruvyl transferase WcaK-like protein
MPIKFLGRLKEINPSVGLVTGADIMDGHYSPVMSLRMIIAADLLACWGARTAFIGFSLNDRPAPLVRYAFQRLDSRVRVNLRDPLSWARYGKMTGRAGNLVADSAFLLKPAATLDAESQATVEWMQAQRAGGRKLLILNLHPMLFPSAAAAAGTTRLLASTLAVMKALTEKHGLSWVLLPHDNRAASGDMTTLASLDHQIDDALRAHVRLVASPPGAAEIKAIAAFADGAVTGRMHLAIAALGQGTPVMAFAYQDKFAGLMQHFNMPDWLVLDAEPATHPDFLGERIERFVLELPQLKNQVEARLPGVQAAAESTFEGVL